jgi:hypothetical protein
MNFPALVTEPWAQALVVLTAYALALAGSGPVVRYFVLPKGASAPPKLPGVRFDPSAIIGKCENFITVTFVLLDAPEGIAIVFTAKSIVRSEKIRENAGFYLGGTLVNLVWSLAVAGLARVLVMGA